MNHVVTLILSLSLCGTVLGAGLEPATSLDNDKVRYTVPESGYHVLKRGDVTAVVVDNRAVNDHTLFGHRAGYSGVASLTHAKQDANLFVPAYAGLNYEHIHDGTTQPRDILFEPRRAPIELRVVNQHTVELYQAPTPTWKLESVLRYEMLDDGTIEMTLECIPRAKTFRNGYIGLFWASYIHQPESLDIHFKGHDAGRKQNPREIRGVTPSHGVLATHPGANDKRQFKHDDDFPLTLAFNNSKYVYDEPWYYGVSHGMALALIFRPQDQIRLTQSPSGGGKGNPAWDFQYFIPDYEVGKRYRMVMRAMYVPYKPGFDMERITRPHRDALAAPDEKQAVINAEQRLKESGAKFTRDANELITGVRFSRDGVSPQLVGLVRDLPYVRDVSSYETPVTDAGLAELAGLRRLNQLNLGFCQRITDQAMETIRTLKQLRVLNLGFCRRITSEGFQRLYSTPHLLILNVSVTSFSDENARLLKNMTRLSILDIDNTAVTGIGLRHIAECRSLRAIRMVGVETADDGLLALGELKALRHINIRDVPVTLDAIAAFKQKRPQCTVKR